MIDHGPTFIVARQPRWVSRGITTNENGHVVKVAVMPVVILDGPGVCRPWYVDPAQPLELSRELGEGIWMAIGAEHVRHADG